MKLFLIFIGVFIAYSALAFELPVDSSKYIPGSYGGRDFLAAGGDHLGEDVALIEGTSIKAIGDGKIVFYGSASGYGELVCVIEHDLGDEYAFINGKGEVVITRYILSIYGHLRKKKNRDDAGGLQWIVEDDVLEGDVIGYVNDDLHNGDGAEHLHLGIRLSDKQTAMNNDPGKWFRGYNKGTNQYLDFAAASQVIKILQNGGIQNLCKKYNDNPNVICWQPISKNDVGCNNASERRLYRNTTGEIIIVDNSFCPANDLVNVAYSAHDAGYGIGGGGTGSSTGGAWHSGGPYPDDPIYDNDPFVPNADVSIRYLRIKGPGQSNHHTESGAVFYPGQTQSVDLKGKIKNESNDNADLARIQYCATTKKKFRHDERIWIDEDYLDHQEREHDFDPGETITKHGQAFITLASDLSSITVFKGDRSHTFPITEKHLYEKKIPVYFWIDTKIEVGNDEDYDVSCSVGSHCGDEYAKFEVLLPWFNSSFNLSSVGGEAPLQVNFTNTSQAGNGATISSSWDFGDGETSDEENPVHIYNQAGTYTVSLTTTSNWGETRTSQATVVVTDSPINGIVDTNYGSTDPNNPKTLTETLTEGHCFFGTPTTLLGIGEEGNPWEWTCQGENGGADETGYAVLEEEETDPRADVNGDGYIDSSDVNLVMMYSLGFDMSGTGWVDSPTTGDVNCDNTINTTDAMLISRYVNGGDMAGTGWCAE